MARLAPALVVLAGGVVIFGSLSNWGTCPQAPCEGGLGLQSLVPRGGVTYAHGIATLVLGGVLAIVGVQALRRESSRVWWIGFGAALAVLNVVAIFMVQRFSSETDYFLYGPGLGVYLVWFGGVLAAVVCPLLREKPATRPRPPE
ncbi:MAG TPA: hypothetical protein VFV72_13945 [Candidatus Limnocylindrales bacterium]|nr:hypothetical protein [Candidatus Limnocylindrales bacterium]